MLHRLRQIFRPDAHTRAGEFWTWFAANEGVYRALKSLPEEELAHSLQVLRKQLGRYDEHLEPLFGFPDDCTAEFVISAGGHREHFPAARALARAAPALSDWRVIALKPPNPDPIAIELEGQVFDPALVTFAVVEVPDEPDALAIHVFHEAYPEGEHDRHASATFLLLEMLLGERAVAEEVRYVDIRPMSPKVPANVLRPLTSLPTLVAARA